MDDAAKRRALVRQFEDGRDLDETHEIYHDDAVLEFPQSGERFVGKDNFLTWRKRYPAKVDYGIRRITGQGDLWVTELLVTYNGGSPMLGLGVHQFRGDKIAMKVVYVTEAFDAAPGEPSGRPESIRWRRCRHPSGTRAANTGSMSSEPEIVDGSRGVVTVCLE